MMKRMTTVARPNVPTPLEDAAETASLFAAALKRRRAAYRIYKVLAVLTFGAILNSLLWLTGHASQYQMLPQILALAVFVYVVQWVADSHS